MKKEIVKKAKSGAIWTIATNFGLVVVRVGIISILARLLTPADFGVFATFIIFFELAKIGFQSFLNKNVVLHTKENSFLTAAVITSLLHGIIISLVFICAANFLGAYFEMPELVQLLKFGTILILFSALGTVWNSIVEKDINYKWLAKRKVVSTIVGTGIVSIILAYLDFGIWALFIGLLVNEVLDTIFVILYKPIKLQKFSYYNIKEVYSNFGNILLIHVFNKIATKGDYFIVSKFLGEASLGMYSKAYQIMAMPTNLVGQTLNKIGFSSLANYQNDYPLQKKTYIRLTYLVAITLMPLSVVAFYLSDEIILLILGSQWTEAVAPFQILLLGTFFRLAYKIPATIIHVQRRFKIAMYIQAFYAFLIITASYLLFPYGIEGVAFAVLIAIFLQYIIVSIASFQKLDINFNDILNTFSRPILITCSFIAVIEITYLINSHIQYNFKILIAFGLGMFCILVLIKFYKFIVGELGIYWIEKILDKPKNKNPL